MAIIAYPLNDIDYTAEAAQSYFAPRTAGVFSLGKDYVVSSAGGMDLTVSTGRGWMKPSEFTGFSVVSTEPTALTVAESHPTMDRYDRVVLRYDKGANTVEILLVQGTAATEAKVPDIQRTESIYELGLATIHVIKSTLEITADDIKDTRDDVSVCGVVGNDWTGGNSILKIVFPSDYVGNPYTISGGENEVISGTVPESMLVETPIASQNTTYIVACENPEGIQEKDSIDIGPYYGIYEREFSGIGPASPDFASNDWNTIAQAVKDGTAESLWAVGDSKPIRLQGNVLSINVSSLEVAVFILGFNHNKELEGDKLLHLQIGKIDDKIVAFCDASYGFSAGLGSLILNAASSGLFYGGNLWRNVCGNDTPATSPLPDSMMSALPEELRAVMRPAVKYSLEQDASGDWKGYTGHESLMSIFAVTEVNPDYARTEEKSYCQQYDYYKSGNNYITYAHDNLGTAKDFWTRSAYKDAAYSYYALRLSPGGSTTSTISTASYGFVPIIFVG